MAIESYVEDILQSSESTFRKIVLTIVGRSDKNAEIELVRQYTKVDDTLFEAIKSILNDLKIEEGLVSRFLYNFFGIELFKNKKREQLIILGSQLKTQYETLKTEINRVNIHIENLLHSLENLKRLKSAFIKKNKVLKSRQKINKSNALIKKINHKIDELSHYQNSLAQKQCNLTDTERIYSRLYRQIPRYYELQEENYLNLLPSSAS